jgi:hypothetical protein
VGVRTVVDVHAPVRAASGSHVRVVQGLTAWCDRDRREGPNRGAELVHACTDESVPNGRSEVLGTGLYLYHPWCSGTAAELGSVRVSVRHGRGQLGRVENAWFGACDRVGRDMRHGGLG